MLTGPDILLLFITLLCEVVLNFKILQTGDLGTQKGEATNGRSNKWVKQDSSSVPGSTKSYFHPFLPLWALLTPNVQAFPKTRT